MQVHESCGHPTELDRAFGTEASYAGTSFLTPDMLGTFRYGSDLCDIVADATVPGGLGTFGWDDEGVVAQQVPLIKEGIFTGYLSSRETAPRIGRASGGAMRADGWNRIPLIRMTNVNLLPKPGMSFDDIVADTDDGLLFDTNRSWSIDDRRLNFQFSTEICREIKGGKVGRLFRNGTYTGITYELWRSMDAVGDALLVADVGHAQLRQGRAAASPGTWATASAAPGSATCAWGSWHERRGRDRRRPGRRRSAWRRRSSGRPRRPAPARPRRSSWRGDSALTRFANSEIHQNVASSRGLRQPAVRAGHAGWASPAPAGWTRTGIRALVERAAAHHRATWRSSRTGRASRRRTPPNLSRPPGRTGPRPPARSSAPRAPAR